VWNPQLRSLVLSVIRNTLTQLAEFGLYTKSRNVTNSKLDWAVVFTARYSRRKGKNSWSWRETGQTVKGRCRPTWQPQRPYTKGRKQVNPLAGISVRYCVNRGRPSRTCWSTQGSQGNRSWQEYCGICTDAVN